MIDSDWPCFLFTQIEIFLSNLSPWYQFHCKRYKVKFFIDYKNGFLIVELKFMLQFLGNGSNGSRVGKSGNSSVFSLFNLKEKSKFWSESVLRSGMPYSLHFPTLFLQFKYDLLVTILIAEIRFWWFGIIYSRERKFIILLQGRYLQFTTSSYSKTSIICWRDSEF